MEHPRERSGLRDVDCSMGRRDPQWRSARPDSSRAARTRRAARRRRRRPDGAAAKLVVPKPVGPGGLPLPRPDNAVTWAITPENQPIADGRPAERGPLNGLQLRRLHRPGHASSVSSSSSTRRSARDLQLADEAIAKLASGAVGFDVIVGLTGSNIVNLIAQQLLQPLNHSYLPNLRRTSGPSSRTRSTTAAAATRCRTWSGWTASAGATTRSRRTSPPWTFPGTSSGSRRRTAARSALLDDKRDALSMPMQRDAMRTGVRARPQHGGPGAHRQGRERARQLNGHLQHQGHDHRLPDAARGEDGAPPLLVRRPAVRRHLLHAEGRQAGRALVLGA